MSREKFVDGNGHEIDFYDPKINYAPILPGSECCLPSTDANGSIKPELNFSEGIFNWNPEALKTAPRDVFIVGRASAHDRWPLEFTFPIKRNGKILRGNVSVETRPAPIQRD